MTHPKVIFREVPFGYLELAVKAVRAFENKCPDRHGVREGVLYSWTDLTDWKAYVYRTRTGSLVVRGS